MTQEPDLALALLGLQDALGGHYASLSRPKLRLLVKLEDGPVTVSDLADQLHISSPAVSQMIDKLQAQGLVNRQPIGSDQRMVGIEITGAGRQALALSLSAFRARVEELLSVLDATEVSAFARTILKIAPPRDHR